MDQLFRIKDAVAHYLSPPAKRRRTMGPQTPTIGLASEKVMYSVASEPQGAKAKAARFSKISQKDSSPSLGKLENRKRTLDVFESADVTGEFEDEYLDDTLDPKDSSSQITPAEDSIIPTVENEDSVMEVEDEPQMSSEDKVKEFLARQAEHNLRKEAVEKAKASGSWHPDEITLFEKISLRSFEPLLSPAWKIDFPTIPQDMFTDDINDAFFNATFGEESHAWRKLQELVNNIKRVSSIKYFNGRPAEDVIAVSIKNYIKWSERDGGYHKLRFIPNVVVVKARAHQSIDQISKRTTSQMTFLAARYRQHFAQPGLKPVNGVGEVALYKRTLPVIYGILIAKTNVIFFTLNSANTDADASPRHIAHFNLNDPKMGFWDAMSIGIIVIMARNYMISIKDQLEPEELGSDDGKDA